MHYSLLVFEIAFYNPCNITDGTYKEVGGWEGWEWWGWGAGGNLKAGPPCHYATDSGAVPSTDDRNVHKPQDGYRLRRPLAATWHPTNSD